MRAQKRHGATAAACVVIQDGIVELEKYAGATAHALTVRPVAADSRFNVYSVRKTYIGLAASLCMETGRFGGPDDRLADYVGEPEKGLFQGVSLRHLLTHTHGLEERNGRIVRRFPPGRDWHYNNTGMRLLCLAIERAAGLTVRSLLVRDVFPALGLTATDWAKEASPELVRDVGRTLVNPLAGWRALPLVLGPADGAARNLCVSAGDLALWGWAHLTEGTLGGFAGSPRVAPVVWRRAVTVMTPPEVHPRKPRNGFGWWIKDLGESWTEIGRTVPAGAYQILGMSGCLVLVVPSLRLVAARLYNSLAGNRLAFIRDARHFGDLVVTCALQNRNF